MHLLRSLTSHVLVCVGLISLLPRLSSSLGRYVSFSFHLPYAFLVFAFIPSFTRLFIGFGPVTGVISCSGEVPIGASIDIAIHFLSVFWFGQNWYSGCSLCYLGAFSLSGSALTWIGDFRESTPSSAHPS